MSPSAKTPSTLVSSFCIDANESTLVGGNAGSRQVQGITVGRSASGHEKVRGLHRTGFGAGAHADIDVRCFFLHALSFGVQQHINSVLFENVGYFPGHVGIFAAK